MRTLHIGGPDDRCVPSVAPHTRRCERLGDDFRVAGYYERRKFVIGQTAIDVFVWHPRHGMPLKHPETLVAEAIDDARALLALLDSAPPA